jgi:hypothetical protein
MIATTISNSISEKPFSLRVILRVIVFLESLVMATVNYIGAIYVLR